jgi:hypothetical protein
MTNAMMTTMSVRQPELDVGRCDKQDCQECNCTIMMMVDLSKKRKDRDPDRGSMVQVFGADRVTFRIKGFTSFCPKSLARFIPSLGEGGGHVLTFEILSLDLSTLLAQCKSHRSTVWSAVRSANRPGANHTVNKEQVGPAFSSKSCQSARFTFIDDLVYGRESIDNHILTSLSTRVSLLHLMHYSIPC